MGTTLIKAKVTDQMLEITLKPMVASGGVNEDVIEFEFDKLWDEFDTVAVFYRSKRDVFHKKIVNNRCTVPSEVLKAEGIFYVGVMGVKDSITRTTNVLRYEIEHGAITVGVEPPKPTPSIYESILASVKSAEQLAQSVRDDADAGRFNGAPGIQGPKGDPGEKGEKGDPGKDASVTAANIEAALGYAPVKDVQVAESSVLADGVANVPVASSSGFGVVKTQSWGGTMIDDNGYLVVYPSAIDHVNGRVSKTTITPTNLDYAVKAAMCDGKGAAWTSAEQKAARERMGIPNDAELIKNITVEVGESTAIKMQIDGQYCKLIIGVQLPIMPEGALSLFTYIYVDGTNDCIVGTRYGSVNNTYSVRLEASIENGIISGRSCGQVPEWGGGQLFGLNSAGVIRTGSVFKSMISVYTTDKGRVIPKGTTINVYGVKI